MTSFPTTTLKDADVGAAPTPSREELRQPANSPEQSAAERLANYLAAKLAEPTSDTASATPSSNAPRALPPPMVSIVITCYNQAQFLEQAIRSALAQSYEEIEVLVLDDGSTDHTRDVAVAFPSVQYFYQPNRGLPAARNAGLYLSKGDYVTFLDADDRFTSDAVEAGMRCFQRNPECAFVFGDFRNVSVDGAPLDTREPERVEHDHYARLLQGNFIGMHGTVLYRRASLITANGFDDTLPACEDYDLYLRITRHEPIAGHPRVVAEYRQHRENMSKDRALMLQTVLTVLKRQRSQVPDRRHRRALRSGMQVWRRYYGPGLLKECRTHPSRWLTALRLWPEGFLRAAATHVVRLLPERIRVRVHEGSIPLRIGRPEPVSRQFGLDRGQPIDRYYIEGFLQANAASVFGRVLEIGDDAYSRRFGGNRITFQEVLHVNPGYPGVTVIGDISHAPHLKSDSYDCIILTQTLHYIFDVSAAVAEVKRILKPGGIALVSVPGISQICRDQEDKESDTWRFTESGVRRLFAHEFGEEFVTARAYGNVNTATAFLRGLCMSDVKPADLDYHDPQYQMVITLRAVKPPF